MAHLSFRDQAVRYFSRPHEGVPDEPLRTPAAWKGADMRGRREEWLERWSVGEVRELERAAERTLAAGLELADMDRGSFEAPQAAARLERVAREVADGRGFVVLRGLPVGEWGDELTSRIYWGMAQHLGRPGPQNPEGELLGHVTDYGEQAANPMVRLYRTTSNIDFHCDGADAVGLLCLRTAQAGGQSRIASSVTVFNEIVRRRPELVETLFAPMPLDRRGEEGPGQAPVTLLQPCCYAGGRLSTFYHSEYFRSAARHGGDAAPTSEQRALLDLYDDIAGDPDVHLDMWLEPGDFQLVSNHTVVHARTDYIDHPEPSRRRHLLRLWLTFEHA